MSNAETHEALETLVSLRYPNGRVHETAVDRKLRAGEHFQMYGRTWTAVQQRRHGNGRRQSLVPSACWPTPGRAHDSLQDVNTWPVAIVPTNEFFEGRSWVFEGDELPGETTRSP